MRRSFHVTPGSGANFGMDEVDTEQQQLQTQQQQQQPPSARSNLSNSTGMLINALDARHTNQTRINYYTKLNLLPTSRQQQIQPLQQSSDAKHSAAQSGLSKALSGPIPITSTRQQPSEPSHDAKEFAISAPTQSGYLTASQRSQLLGQNSAPHQKKARSQSLQEVKRTNQNHSDGVFNFDDLSDCSDDSDNENNHSTNSMPINVAKSINSGGLTKSPAQSSVPQVQLRQFTDLLLMAPNDIPVGSPPRKNDGRGSVFTRKK